MLATIIGFPILGLVLLIQTIVARSLNMINGSTDLIMLVIIAWALQKRVSNSWVWALIGGVMVGSVSALPFYLPIITYLFIAGLAIFLQNRVWQTPILAMLVITCIGSIIINFLSVMTLQILGVPLQWESSFQMVILPSTLLNLLLAFPVYALITDFSGWVFPNEEEK